MKRVDAAADATAADYSFSARRTSGFCGRTFPAVNIYTCAQIGIIILHAYNFDVLYRDRAPSVILRRPVSDAAAVLKTRGRFCILHAI